jgi:hypothetical protein
MPRQSREMVSDATVRQSPMGSEIAAAAYKLWLYRGCPVGSDQEDWFQAEAILHLFRRPSIPCGDTLAEPEMPADLVLEGGPGHWEIWEREWVCAHWVGDELDSGVALRCHQAAA